MTGEKEKERRGEKEKGRKGENNLNVSCPEIG